MLLLGAPEDKIVPKVDEKTTCGSTIVQRFGPVRIGVDIDVQSRCGGDFETFSDSTFSKANEMFHPLPVFWLRKVHLLTCAIESKLNVWTGES